MPNQDSDGGDLKRDHDNGRGDAPLAGEQDLNADARPQVTEGDVGGGEPTPPPEATPTDDFVGGRNFLTYLLLGWFVQLVFSFSSEYGKVVVGEPFIVRAIRTFCILWFVGSGGYFVGMISGFLFGFPKSNSSKPSDMQSSEDKMNITQGANANNAPRIAEKTRDNTNLEEISDWLTKIIVGLGLVNAQSILSHIWQFGNYISAAVSGTAVGGAVDLGVAVIAIASAFYGFACGFLFFYMWSRKELAWLLNKGH
jgi:hypothetical protein